MTHHDSDNPLCPKNDTDGLYAYNHPDDLPCVCPAMPDGGETIPAPLRPLTEGECRVLARLADAWNAFMELPAEEHIVGRDPVDEFRHGVHALQNAIMARPAAELLRAVRAETFARWAGVEPAGGAK